MILSMDSAKCTIILLGTTLKEIGPMIWRKDKEPWIGLILGKSILGNGITIFSMVGEFISGSNLKEKVNTSEIGMKETGPKEFVRDMEYFIMQTELNMKDIGKIIWRKVLHFIPMKMVKFLTLNSKKTVCWEQEWHLHFKIQTRSQFQKNKYSQTFTRNVYTYLKFSIHSSPIWSHCSICCWEITLNWSIGIRAFQIFMTNNQSLVSVSIFKESGKWSEHLKYLVTLV